MFLKYKQLVITLHIAIMSQSEEYDKFLVENSRPISLDDDQIEKWIGVCREKVAILKYLSSECHINGHLMTVISHAEALEVEIADAIASATALMASKTNKPATFCDTTVTLSPLHVSIDRLMLEHALLRAQIATKRTSSYQFANALQMFNEQYEDLINGPDLVKIMALTADFSCTHSAKSYPIAYDTICQQRDDISRINTIFEAFRDDVKHLLRSARSLKLMAPQKNSINDNKCIDEKIEVMESRLLEIGEWIVRQQRRLMANERDSKRFDTLWHDVIKWIDEASNELDGSSGNLKKVRAVQIRFQNEKINRYVNCIRLGQKLASMAKVQGNEYDFNLLDWQNKTTKERFKHLEDSIQVCKKEATRIENETQNQQLIVKNCKHVIEKSKAYMAKVNRKSSLPSCEEVTKLTELLDTVYKLENDERNGIIVLKSKSCHLKNAEKMAENFEKHLKEIRQGLEKRSDVLKHDLEATKSFFDSYKYCRKLVDDFTIYISTRVTFFDDEAINELISRLEVIKSSFDSIPPGDGLKFRVDTEMSALLEEIHYLIQTVDYHCHQRLRARSLLAFSRKQMAINRSKFNDFIRSNHQDPKVKAPLIHEFEVTKQKLQRLISGSVSVQANSSPLLRRNVKSSLQASEPLCRYMHVAESAEARQLYLECTRLARKLQQ